MSHWFADQRSSGSRTNDSRRLLNHFEVVDVIFRRGFPGLGVHDLALNPDHHAVLEPVAQVVDAAEGDDAPMLVFDVVWRVSHTPLLFAMQVFELSNDPGVIPCVIVADGPGRGIAQFLGRRYVVWLVDDVLVILLGATTVMSSRCGEFGTVDA